MSPSAHPWQPPVYYFYKVDCLRDLVGQTMQYSLLYDWLTPLSVMSSRLTNFYLLLSSCHQYDIVCLNYFLKSSFVT